MSKIEEGTRFKIIKERNGKTGYGTIIDSYYKEINDSNYYFKSELDSGDIITINSQCDVVDFITEYNFKVGDYIEDEVGDRVVITKIDKMGIWGYWELKEQGYKKTSYEQFTCNKNSCKLVEKSINNKEVGCASENKTTKNGIMESITEFAKNLVLSEDEKLLRKFNLKDSNGNYLSSAKDIVMQKLLADNEKYLIEIATKMAKEIKDNK
jgi:hypothetical protein